MFFADATILPTLDLDLDFGFTPWMEQEQTQHEQHQQQDVKYPYHYQLHHQQEPCLSSPDTAAFTLSSQHTTTAVITPGFMPGIATDFSIPAPTSGASSPLSTSPQTTATTLDSMPNMAMNIPPAPTPTSGGAGSPAVSSPQTTPTTAHEDERRMRRRQSNKESARRSRMRIRQRQQELEKEAALLAARNREIADKLGAVKHCVGLYRANNTRMQAECRSLRQRLVDVQLLVLVRQLQRRRQEQQQQLMLQHHHLQLQHASSGGGTNLTQQVGMGPLGSGGFGFLTENGQILTT